jgi:hypothetical protein
MNVIITLLVGAFIGFVISVSSTIRRMTALEEAIYNIDSQINIILDISKGPDDVPINKMAKKIKGMTEVFYIGN